MGYSAFKCILIRQQNLSTHNRKSRQPILHPNMRSFAIKALVSLCAYTYGLSYLMADAPKSQANIQMGDYNSLPWSEQTNPELQEHYIFATMRVFKVSDRLVAKAIREFEMLAEKEPELLEKKEDINTEVVKSMWQKWKTGN